MSQSKEVHKEYMRVHRKDLKGSQNTEVHNKGSQEELYPGIYFVEGLSEDRKQALRDMSYGALQDWMRLWDAHSFVPSKRKMAAK